MQAELYLPRRRADAADLTEVAIRDSIVGISVACDVKDVEEVGAEVDAAAVRGEAQPGRLDVLHCATARTRT